MITPRRAAIMCGITRRATLPGSREVDVDHGVPGVVAQLVSQPIAADPGVVEEDVEASEVVEGAPHGRGDRRIIADVGGEGQALHTQIAALRRQRVEIGRTAHGIAGILEGTRHVERRDVHAFTSQCQRRGTSLAVCGTGDQGHLPGQLRRGPTALAASRVAHDGSSLR